MISFEVYHTSQLLDDPDLLANARIKTLIFTSEENGPSCVPFKLQTFKILLFLRATLLRYERVLNTAT
jgi:hypothetical protein